MASKFQYISELAGITLKKISSSGVNWRSYLQTASRLYRYPFNEQVLIYAQRPDATACAGIDLWNNKMHRWVKRGAKGIALIDENSGSSRLKYVFDISDTSSHDNIPAPHIWQFRKNHEPYLRETLSNAFGEVQADDAADFSCFIGEIAVNAVQDNGIDYVQELEQSREGSWLDDLDELNAEKWFNDLVTDSVTYCVLSRLGINPANILHDEDFRNICDFNTPETISILGTATSHISEMVLTVIAREVRSLEKQQFFDNQKNVLHNEVKQEERSVDHGTGIQDVRRVSDSGSERGGNNPDLGEIRHDAAELSQKPQEGDVQQPAVDQQTGEPFIGDGPIGKGTGESLDASDGEGSGGDRSAESHGSDEMGTADERHKAERRGNGDTRDDTQLEYYDRQREDKSLPFFHEDRKIKGILHSTPYLKATLKEIEDYFNIHSDSGERTAYIKSIFNNEPTELEVDGSLVGYKTFKNVLHLWEGGIDSPTAQGYYDWGVIANYYDGMRIMGELKSESRMFPTTSEQISIIRQAEEQKASAFVFPQELIDSVLQGGSHIEHGKYRIYRHFEGKPDVSESVKFLKQEYGIGGHSPVIIGTGICEFHDAKGIRFTKDKDCLNLSWDKAAKRIGELIAADRYLNTKEKEYYPVFLEKERENEQQTAEREYARAVLGQAPEGSQPDEEKTDRKTADYRFNLGDTVYIGANEYQVLAFDSEIVRLYDNDYPLLNKEISRTEFDRFLRETSLNDHLIVSGLTEAEPEQFVIEENKIKADDTELENHELINTTQKVDVIKPPPKQELHNFRITDDNLGHGGAKTKYHNNVEAIKLLKSLETDHGFATPEEQEILSRYVGWGGLPQVFDEMNENWKSEFDELRSLLSSKEYASAKASTLSAYYTSPTIIRTIYKAVENMGFRTGNILEPSCGTGNFLGLIPDTMQNSKVYGIELDFITGGIAKQLYQKNNIAVQGFEDTELPDSFFDLSVGNVPFGSFTVPDKRYDKYKFLIHDYFFAKTLDKVRPGGIIVFVTSRGTMDKKNPIVRKYIAQRAELLGAIRLPNTAFQANAGTEVTADILFLQKRDRVIDVEPDWVHLSTTENGIPINSYFAENSDMVLGTMSFESGMYGDQQTTCTPFPGSNLAEQLEEAILNIHADYESLDLNLDGEDIESREDSREVSIPADPNVRNFSYTLVDGQIYYRENSRMNRVETSETAENRIKGMIEIRECVRRLISYQTDNNSDEEIRAEQVKLHKLYDRYTQKYGLLNDRGNSMAFSDDSAYPLLCSLEVLDEDGKLERKADMFSKRTIRCHAPVTQVDTAVEALAVSIGEKAGVDLHFMQNLAGIDMDKIIEDLNRIIFRMPQEGEPVWVTADEYLSGNVREKLKLAKVYASDSPEFEVNVSALEAALPKDLTAAEIDVRLGAIWLPPDVIKDFIFEFLETPYVYQRGIDVHYSDHTGNWNVQGKSSDRSDNVKARVTYGTKRINAYSIIEETLNLRDVRIFDTVLDEERKEKRVLNKKETIIAQQKQEAIKEGFKSWIWKDQNRRERLTQLYNERFNAVRPREYNGDHIRFNGMNPEIILRKHQIDAVARQLYGGNSLLAHCVGAGKTFAITAAAMESKHLGLCHKSMIAVPNHLTEQWGAEFLQLYPSANILVSTKKDFEPQNRKKFCARIATGDYDAVIIGHSQFEKIPVSQARQVRMLNEQIDDTINGISDLKQQRAERFQIKQLERTRKALEAKLKKLNDQSRKDDVVTFEELGIDRLFVDEADIYKNLFLYTKMRNVAGIGNQDAQRASDMYAKCRYMDELTGGKGIIFATGTPISNSVSELYTMQRYLQYDMLVRNGLQHFDAWASTFGETVTAIELAPEGTGYRSKTRFARFYNLPELMAMFKEVADIQTEDMLNLPVPKANYCNISVKPSDFQKDMVGQLAERADAVRKRMVEPNIDNMLKITNDGRKLALDQRLANEMLPDFAGSKVNACVDKIFEHWEQGKEQRLTQLAFCDLSTPKADVFNVYHDVRNKLIIKGIPEDEIAFIHDANTDVRKKELFAKVRKGQIRVLLGSTSKMGAGTNVQNLIIASHDLDAPWRPRDLTQRGGRTIRQGNQNSEVYIYRYVTENTFDSYMWQTLENKQKFISQIMTGKSPVRSCEDVDDTTLSYAEVKALATGNPYIKEKMEIDIAVSRLKMLEASYNSQVYALEDKVAKDYPRKIAALKDRIINLTADTATYEQHKPTEDEKFVGMNIRDKVYTDKAEAGKAIIEACKIMTSGEPQKLGEYMGFSMHLSYDEFAKEFKVTLKGKLSHTISLGADIHGNITRLNNEISNIPSKLAYCKTQLQTEEKQLETAKHQLSIPFDKADELAEKTARLAQLNALLNMDDKTQEVLDDGADAEPETIMIKKQHELEHAR